MIEDAPVVRRPLLDRRLRPAEELIVDGTVSVLSLDIFDTLLWRVVPRPTDAFILLGRELADRECLHPWIEPAAFRRLRIEAEVRARRRRDERGEGTEVSLEDIWREFPPSVVPSAGQISMAEMAEMEVELERRVTWPDLDVLALATLARERGVEVVLVSNTYFSERQLRRILAHPELSALAGVRIFPSSGYGVHKGTGLLEILLEAVQVPPARVVHVGDEAHADVDAPRELGIRSVHFERFPAELEDIIRSEGALPPEPKGPSLALLHPRLGDFGITALRAKAAGRPEGDARPGIPADAWRFGATVLGPVLAGFAAWVHRRAREAGAETAWCMMREGELLADVLNLAAGYVDSPVVAKPIWMSRHLTARAGIYRGDAAELRLLLARRLRPTVGEFLGNLGLTLGEVPELRAHAPTRIEDPSFTDMVLAALTGSEHLRARVRAEAEAARARLLRYVDDTVGLDAGKAVLVDLGWGGTTQRQLQAVLDGSGAALRTIGLYLLTNDKACGGMLDGLEMDSYLAHCGEPADAAVPISRSPEVIEQACLATAGSVLDFSADGSPILDSSTPPPGQVMAKVAVQGGIKAFHQELARYRRSVPELPRFDGGERSILVEILRRSVLRPTATEAAVFGSWFHEDNFGTEHRETIIPEHLAPLVPYLSPSDLLEMTNQRSFWPMGFAARHDPHLAAAALAVAEGHVPPAAFEPSRATGVMAMWADSGAGFQHRVERKLAVNRNGLCYGRFTFRERGVTAVRFDPCNFPAVLRLDWIDVALKVIGRSDMVRFRLEGEADFSGLTYAHCRWLYDGVVLATTSDPQIHVSFRHRAPGEVYLVDVEVAFSALQLPGPQSSMIDEMSRYSQQLRRLMGKVRAEYAEGGVRAVGRGGARVAKRRLTRLS